MPGCRGKFWPGALLTSQQWHWTTLQSTGTRPTFSAAPPAPGPDTQKDESRRRTEQMIGRGEKLQCVPMWGNRIPHKLDQEYCHIDAQTIDERWPWIKHQIMHYTFRGVTAMEDTHDLSNTIKGTFIVCSVRSVSSFRSPLCHTQLPTSKSLMRAQAEAEQ